MTVRNEIFRKLRAEAMRAAGHSWSPYSRFRVGAAVIGREGAVYRGCNVENASFGLTQCAERSALTAAVAGGEKPGTLPLLLLYTPGETAHAPCGACRQVMNELLAPDAVVISCCDGSGTARWSAEEYLPDPFNPEDLPAIGGKTQEED